MYKKSIKVTPMAHLRIFFKDILPILAGLRDRDGDC